MRFKRLLTICTLMPALAFAQAGPFRPGQVLTSAQLNQMWTNMVRWTGGTFTGPVNMATLNVTGSTTLNGLTHPLPVSSGGTGANDAATARANLGLVMPALPISVANGGTGATDAATARSNLGITPPLELPINISNGGTGAVDAATARANLGITPPPDLPISISNGGTGATDSATARSNLGITPPPALPISVANGGTGANDAATARSNLGIVALPALPLSISNGGTGAADAPTARANLGIIAPPALPISVANGGTGATDSATARANLGVINAPVPLVAETSMGGQSMVAWQCTSQNIVVTGAVVGNQVEIWPVTDPGGAFRYTAFVLSAGIVTTRICSGSIIATPVLSVYKIRVYP